MKKIFALVLCIAMLFSCTVFASAEGETPERHQIEVEKITYEAYKPVIDGVITEEEWGKPFFDGDPAQSPDYFVWSQDYDIDLSHFPSNVKLYLRWTDYALYYGAVIEEKVFWNGHTGEDVWYGDSVQFDICVSDTNQKARWRTNTAFSQEKNRVESYLNQYPNEDNTGLEWGNGAGRIGETMVKVDGNTVTYEIEFPWFFYTLDGTVSENQQLLINMHFYLADGNTAGPGTRFEGSTNHGLYMYGKYAVGTDGMTSSIYPLMTLVAEKNPPEPPAQPTTPDEPIAPSEPTTPDEPAEPTEPSEPTEPEDPAQKSFHLPSLIAWIAIAAAVIAVAAVAVIIIKKKKKA